MDNNELLTQISSMMEQQTERLEKKFMQEISSIHLILENEIRPSIQTIAEGHKGLSDKLSRIDKIADDIEEIKGAIVAVETIARHSV